MDLVGGMEMRMNRKIFAAAILASVAFSASPALADAITFDSTDIGVNYTLNYDGFSDATTIAGLTSTTTFSLASITGNTYTFNYSVANTSTAPITGSRVSGFAFNVDPNITGATSTGAFAYTTLNSTYPNGIGLVDVCFKDASTGACAGGGSGGLTQGTSGTGTFTLSFAQPVSSITLSDFFTRYQSITGAGNVTSASGSGTLTGTTTTTGGTQVPEPGMLGLLGTVLIGGAALHRRRQRRATLRLAAA